MWDWIAQEPGRSVFVVHNSKHEGSHSERVSVSASWRQGDDVASCTVSFDSFLSKHASNEYLVTMAWGYLYAQLEKHERDKAFKESDDEQP